MSGNSSSVQGGFSLFRFIIQNFYWITLCIIIIPSIISAVKVANETDNYSYPFVLLGTRIIGADNALYNDVNTLSTTPETLIGMSKPTIIGEIEPTAGERFKYYWYYFKNVIWKLISDVWLIIFPFIVIHRICKLKTTDHPFSTFMLALLIFGGFMFFINLILVIVSLTSGSTDPALNLVHIDNTSDRLALAGQVVINTLPLRGIWSLLVYFWGMF